MPAVAFGPLRIEPFPERLVVETVRKRPAGEPSRLRAAQDVRYRARAHAHSGSYVVTRQAKLVTLAQDVPYVDHVGLMPMPPQFDSWIDEAVPEET